MFVPSLGKRRWCFSFYKHKYTHTPIIMWQFFLRGLQSLTLFWIVPSVGKEQHQYYSYSPEIYHKYSKKKLSIFCTTLPHSFIGHSWRNCCQEASIAVQLFVVYHKPFILQQHRRLLMLRQRGKKLCWKKGLVCFSLHRRTGCHFTQHTLYCADKSPVNPPRVGNGFERSKNAKIFIVFRKLFFSVVVWAHP